MKTLGVKMLAVFKWLMIQQKKRRYINPKVRKKYKKRKRNKSKYSRALGIEHISISGKHVMPRSIGPNCKCRSKYLPK